MLLEGQHPEPLHLPPHRTAAPPARQSLPWPCHSPESNYQPTNSDSCSPAKQSKPDGHGSQQRTLHLPHLPPACSLSEDASAFRREIMPPTAFLVHQGKASYMSYMWISAGNRTDCACCRCTTIFPSGIILGPTCPLLHQAKQAKQRRCRHGMP
jgi:hypothetical protein